MIKYGYDRSGYDNVSFTRAGVDGMPFRGPSALLREEEYEDLTTQVNDFHHGIFDLGIPEQAREVEKVMDESANHWVQVLRYDTNWITRPDGTPTVMVYLAYVRPYRELNRAKVNTVLPQPVPFNLLSGPRN